MSGADEGLEIGKTDAAKIAAAERRVGNLSHAAKIAAAMMPEPREWAFQGEVFDSGTYGAAECTCGHPIRYVFVIRRERDGKALDIGSTCIEETVPALIAAGAEKLAQDLQAAVEAHRKALEDAKRKVRDASNDGLVKVLLGERAALKGWVNDLKASGAYLDRALFDFQRNPEPKACSTPGRTAAALRRGLEGVYVAALLTVKPERPAPVPQDAALLNAVGQSLLERWKWYDAKAATAEGEVPEDWRKSLWRYEIALEKLFGAPEGPEEPEPQPRDEGFGELPDLPAEPAPRPSARGYLAADEDAAPIKPRGVC